MVEQEFHVDGNTPGDFEPGDGQENHESPVSGAQHNKRIPGNEGFYTSGGGGGGNAYNSAEEIMSFPADDPGRYLPRANIDEKFLKRMVRTGGRIQRMYTGYENPLESRWMYLAGTAALNGNARRDFVTIATGNRQVEMSAQSGGFLAGIRDRLAPRNPNNPLAG